MALERVRMGTLIPFSPVFAATGAGVIENADFANYRNGKYLLISPCRDEARYMRETLDSVISQSVRPAKWIIVDDGSTDSTPQILAEYRAKHDWIEVVTRCDRGQRSVGPGRHRSILRRVQHYRS